MARHLRIEFPGAIYHVTVRMLGSWKQERNQLFEDDADRERFLARLAERVEQFEIRLYLFVCMANHVHMVFETPRANCSRFMQSLSTSYTVYFNLRHGRHGHLFDGRYRAKLVDGEEYLLALSRYVHLNPVYVEGIKDRPIEERIRRLRQYPWSSYPSYIGQRKALDFVQYGPLLGEMGGKRRAWPKRYREFVETGLAEEDEEFKAILKDSPRSVGGASFRAWVGELYQKRAQGHRHPEDVALRRITEPLTPDAVLDALGEVFDVDGSAFRQRRRNSPLRGVAARLLAKHCGRSQREIAGILGMGTGAAVSVQMRKLGEWISADSSLERRVLAAERRLSELRARRTLPAAGRASNA